MRTTLNRMAIAALVATIAVIALTTVANASQRRFEPDYPMSKQYVAVSVYKILRDHAPSVISDCEADVKREPSRFADIGDAGLFTQGAINCLDKLGMLSGLPGGKGDIEPEPKPASDAMVLQDHYFGGNYYYMVFRPNFSCSGLYVELHLTNGNRRTGEWTNYYGPATSGVDITMDFYDSDYSPLPDFDGYEIEWRC